MTSHSRDEPLTKLNEPESNDSHDKLNHARVPNCEAIATGSRVFIHAITAIHPGEEPFIDYRLVADGKITDDVCAEYA